jgi:Cys-tRNA(Pro)/Cys-tRNA(Cys) deacylase
MKTNAARILDHLGVRYELREYEVGADDLTAEIVAAKIGLPPEQVFKTPVARGERHGVCLAVIPGNYELDLKALGILTADKKIELVPLKEVLPLTGYVRGGVTALGCKKDYAVYADETIEFDIRRPARHPDPALARGLPACHSRRSCGHRARKDVIAIAIGRTQ